MEFWNTKEAKILEAMHEVLHTRGYVIRSNRERYEQWEHPELGVGVGLGYTASTHDPIYAVVSMLPEDNCKAWNARALKGHLDEAETVAVERLELRKRMSTRREF